MKDAGARITSRHAGTVGRFTRLCEFRSRLVLSRSGCFCFWAHQFTDHRNGGSRSPAEVAHFTNKNLATADVGRLEAMTVMISCVEDTFDRISMQADPATVPGKLSMLRGPAARQTGFAGVAGRTPSPFVAWPNPDRPCTSNCG